MQTTTQLRPWSVKRRWSAHFIRAMSILFLSFDASMKLLRLAPAMEATIQLGYPAQAVMGIGMIELICLVLYSIPRTMILGAILLTGYLGGAVATHVRIESAPFSVVFPVLLGMAVWGGVVLREPQLWALFWRSTARD
ncbi:MAG TPA: DoxX family protein [Herpetosiphonaceae bacterium]